MSHDYNTPWFSTASEWHFHQQKNHCTCLIYLPKFFCEVTKQLSQTAVLACSNVHATSLEARQGSVHYNSTTPASLAGQAVKLKFATYYSQMKHRCQNDLNVHDLKTQLFPRDRRTAGLILLLYWDNYRLWNSANLGSYNEKFKSLCVMGSSLKNFHCIRYHSMHLS